MALDNPKYDIAISFLASDEGIAAELSRQLSETLKVFFFPERQKELAGTDGMETMRTPFYEDSRVMLVLFREGWGKTRWTAIEELAIKEACFNGEWKRLFFVTLDRTSTLPGWLPPNYVRYNWEDFGAEQVVGIIKARVLEGGGNPSAMTAFKRAELYRQDEEYRRARSSIEQSFGMSAVHNEVKALFETIKAKCDEISTAGHVQVACELDLRRQPTSMGCIITDSEVGAGFWWNQPFANIMQNSAFPFAEYNGRLILPSETGRYYIREPKVLKTTKYKPDISRARELGWSLEKSDEFISTAALAEDIVIRFLNLAERRKTGKLAPLDY
ncbi:MAG: hypothetical protein M3O31_16575 [Acidobacteriota bacterium]|nr:hypothetical protein [Acidobacteriota bacterium]